MADSTPNSNPNYTIKVESDAAAPSVADSAQEAWNALEGGDFVSAMEFVLETAFGRFAAGAISFLPKLIDTALAVLLPIISNVEGINAPEFYQLAAVILEDFLGIEYSSDLAKELYATRGKGLRPFQLLGKRLTDLLINEFKPSGDVDSSTVQVETFVGFLLAFAIREWNFGFFTDFLPFELGAGFREIGSNIARALGLGRLARRGLTPIIDTLVQTPLQWHLNGRYPTTLLSPGQSLAAQDAGLQQSRSFEEILAKKGNDLRDYEAIRHTTYKHADVYDLSRLIRWGEITEEQAQHIRTLENEPLDQSRARIRSQILSRADSDGSYAKSALRNALASGAIDIVTATEQLHSVGVTDTEIQAMGLAASLARDARSRRLSTSQMIRAFEDGIIALDDLQSFMLNEGFTDESIRIQIYQTLSDSKDAVNKALAQNFKEQSQNARLLQRFRKGIGKVVGETNGIWDRDPGTDDVTSAFLQGFVTLDEAQEWYKAQGLSEQDIQTKLTDLTNSLGSRP